MNKSPSHFKGDTHPVENVSWSEAVLFCNKLSEKEGLQPVYSFPKPFVNTDDWAKKVRMSHQANGYRLPTEAQWEYAARGGEEHFYAGSHEMDEVAWHRNNSHDKTQPVGLKKVNGFGLHDMSGNVWEWVWDRYEDYSSEAKTDPAGPNTGSRWGNRGGSWFSLAKDLRVSFRSDYAPSRRGRHLGFRLARTVVE